MIATGEHFPDKKWSRRNNTTVPGHLPSHFHEAWPAINAL